MKITKYEQSCLDITLDGKRLLIDPGIVTTTVPNYQNIDAVLVTHMHPDHFDLDKLLAIRAENPDCHIYTVQAVAGLVGTQLELTIINRGDIASVGPFNLEFFGGQHAVIHSSTPTTDNVGVTINGQFYYSGDSLSVPSLPIDILAVPITAPWLKISEAMDFITAMKPKRVFPVHDALLSDFGFEVNGKYLKNATEAIDAEFITLKPGESLST